MKKKFAFILMGPEYTPEHKTIFETPHCDTLVYTVRSFAEAEALVCRIAGEGVGAIELCGAFGEEKARRLIALTEGRVAIGFVTHLTEQNTLFDQFFS